MIAWNMVKCFETVYFGDTVALLSNVLAIGQLFVITTCDQELFREMFLRTFPTVGVSRQVWQLSFCDVYLSMLCPRG